MITIPLTIRQGSILARLWAGAAVAIPAIGRWLGRTADRARQLALYVGGFGSICYAAWQIAEPAGWATFGVSCLLLEALTPAKPPAP